MSIPGTKWKLPLQKVEEVEDQANHESGCNSAGESQHTEKCKENMKVNTGVRD